MIGSGSSPTGPLIIVVTVFRNNSRWGAMESWSRLEKYTWGLGCTRYPTPAWSALGPLPLLSYCLPWMDELMDLFSGIIPELGR